MSSSSRRRTEHIERIRYPNPLPLPPYPPKLLSIPTPSSRYADPRKFGNRLASSLPLPVVADSEAGMPLDMTDFPQAWYTDQEIEADGGVYPTLDSSDEIDPEDAFLLSDLLGRLPAHSSSQVAGQDQKGVDKAQITWLRRTEYLGAEKKKKEREMLASKGEAALIDSSRKAQLSRIKASFATANKPIASIRHPTKPHLKAVEEHSLLPDPETWATRYDVFRFGDMPGRTINNKPIEDPRLQASILRPHLDLLNRDIYSFFLINAPEDRQVEEEDNETSDGEGSGSDAPRRKKRTRRLYRSREEEISEENESVQKLVESRKEGRERDGAEVEAGDVDPFDVQDDEEEAKTHLNFVREYEPHDETNRKDQELILTFCNADAASTAKAGTLPPAANFERAYRRRRNGTSNGETNGTSAIKQNIAYYHPVTSRASLRVRRRRANDPRPLDHWDAISLGKRSLSTYEKIERLHERRSVDDFDAEALPERIELPDEIVEEEAAPEAAEAAVASDVDDARSAASSLAGAGEKVAASPNQDRAVEQDEAAAGDSEADEKLEEGDAGSDGSSEAGSDEEGTMSDEDMDQDELAALQADATQEGDEVIASSRRGGRGARRGDNSTPAAGKDTEDDDMDD